MTTAELLGEKAYVAPEVTLAGVETVSNAEDLGKAKVRCNYPISAMHLVAVDASGNRTVICRKAFGRDDVNEKQAFAPKLSSFSSNLTRFDLAPGTYRIVLEVIPSTGGVYTPVTFDYTVN